MAWDDEIKTLKFKGTDVEMVRYFKDKKYRESLSEEKKAKLPKNPAGEVEVPDEELIALRPMLTTTKECYSARTSIGGCGHAPPKTF